jgi:hypothetical protein
MNRRAFLATLAAGAAGLVLDPERLLWVPGAKTFFLPSPKPVGISMRFVREWTVQKHVTRFDVLYGMVLRPDLVCHISNELDPDSFTAAELVREDPSMKRGIAAAAQDLADRIDADALRHAEAQLAFHPLELTMQADPLPSQAMAGALWPWQDDV